MLPLSIYQRPVTDSFTLYALSFTLLLRFKLLLTI